MTTRRLFERHDLRCTAQRQALYETLRQCKCHPTAEELHRLVEPESGRISLATVYNTLEALCSAGLARKLPTTDGCCRYDGDTSPHLHVRFADSDEIADVPEDLSRQLLDRLPHQVIEEIEQRLGIRIDAMNIQLLASRDEPTAE